MEELTQFQRSYLAQAYKSTTIPPATTTEEFETEQQLVRMKLLDKRVYPDGQPYYEITEAGKLAIENPDAPIGPQSATTPDAAPDTSMARLTDGERTHLTRACSSPIPCAANNAEFEAEARLLRMGLIDKIVEADGEIKYQATDAGRQAIENPEARLPPDPLALPAPSTVHRLRPVAEVHRRHIKNEGIGVYDPPLGTTNIEGEKIIVDAAQQEKPPPAENPAVSTGSAIEMIPGGFRFRGVEVDLSGQPWIVLNEFVHSRTKRLTADYLRETWKDPSSTVVSDQNVKDGIQAVRDALRQALKKANVQDIQDPIVCVDKGENLAWKLLL